MLREQSSSVCTNDFMSILHPLEQNFHPTKCSTIFNRLNIWQQAPGQIERTWKRSFVCTDTCKMSLEHAPGAKPFVCIGLNSRMGQNHHTREQQTKWGKGNKELESLNKLIPFFSRSRTKSARVFVTRASLIVKGSFGVPSRIQE